MFVIWFPVQDTHTRTTNREIPRVKWKLGSNGFFLPPFFFLRTAQCVCVWVFHLKIASRDLHLNVSRSSPSVPTHKFASVVFLRFRFYFLFLTIFFSRSEKRWLASNARAALVRCLLSCSASFFRKFLFSIFVVCCLLCRIYEKLNDEEREEEEDWTVCWDFPVLPYFLCQQFLSLSLSLSLCVFFHFRYGFLVPLFSEKVVSALNTPLHSSQLSLINLMLRQWNKATANVWDSRGHII